MDNKNDVKGWLNEEEALYYKAKFEVDPIDTFRSIGGQMDSIINPDFVEQTEDNWNLWESLNTDGDRKRIRDWHGNTGTVDDDGNVVDDRTLIGSLEEASLSDPDNKKYNIDEMIKGDVIFCASGVTPGDLADGIKDYENKFEVSTFVLHKSQQINKVVKNTYNK